MKSQDEISSSQKRSFLKKMRRKRRRQREAISESTANQQKQEEQEDKNEDASSIGSTQAPVQVKKKKVYGAWLEDIPVGNGLFGDENCSKELNQFSSSAPSNHQTINVSSLSFVRSSEKIEKDPNMNMSQEPKLQKQHHGLRCKKCFSLLVRDKDFDYLNGKLYVNPRLNTRIWEGLIIRGGKVYCQNMHGVGQRRSSTFCDSSREISVLHVDKTTFTENFQQSPEFAGSDKIKNKLKFSDSNRWLNDNQ